MNRAARSSSRSPGHRVVDDSCGLLAIVVIDDTSLGAACGGIRPGNSRKRGSLQPGAASRRPIATSNPGPPTQ